MTRWHRGATPPRGVRGAVAVVLAGLLLLTGCTTAEPPPPPEPVDPSTGSPAAREFLTIGTTDVITQPDPAGITTAASSAISTNVFQTLMTVPVDAAPNERFPKLQAARECRFDTETSYTCTLNEGMTFHNGHELTSSDVKFSIERALRLDIAGSSVSLLDTLERIETPDDLTVRFELNRVDTQFGFALAGPAASIVDEEVYDPDSLRNDPELTVAGSGPYRVSQLDQDEVRFDRFAKYVGPTPGVEQTILLKTFPDSGSLEQAMTDRQVDATWRGLSSAALTRLSSQVARSAQGRTDTGFAPLRLPGARVHRLLWSKSSELRDDAALREAVSTALQGERTLDSIVPPNVPGYVSSFAVGGQEATPDSRPRRSNLVIGVDSRMPDGQDLADVIRSRIEGAGNLSVRVAPDAADADLFLLDEKAWTSTALAWMQEYVDAPAPGSTQRVEELTDRYRASDPGETADGLLSELQKQAAADAVLIPIDQTDEVLYLAEGVTWTTGSFGPGWQLGLWGVTRT